MKQFIGCDAHKRYSVFVAVGEDGRCGPEWKVSHTDGAFEAFLEELPEGSEIALEACSSYYWMVAWRCQAQNRGLSEWAWQRQAPTGPSPCGTWA